MKRFTINDAGEGSYKLTEDFSVAVDVNKVLANPELTKQAVAFALGHILRNSTAGLLKDEHKAGGFSEAKEAIANRAKTINEGKWASVRQAGESAAGTMLAQALARVLGAEVKDAAEMIDTEVERAMNEKGMDPEASGDELTAEQKTERRKLIAKVQKTFADDAMVAQALATIRLEVATKKAAEAAKNAEGKTSAFAK